jgi:alpha-1,3-rhamnosyl/mannosyltransferase
MTQDLQRLGFGVSAWSRGVLQGGHLDGIGIYTQALHDALLRRMAQTQVIPYAFGEHLPLLPCGTPISLTKRMSAHFLKAMLFRQRLTCSVDLFHATDHHIPLLKDVPVVATVMDIIPFLHPEWVSTRLRSAKNWLFKQTILSADHLITISEYSKQDLVTHFGLSPERISVTPLGVEADYFEPIATVKRQAVLQQYQLSPGFFLFIGTLQPRKNIETLLRAHAQLPLALQKRHPVVIVGRYGWGVEHLLPTLKQLEEKGTVRWLNYLPKEHAMALLQSARALMFLSLYEGFGLPVLEAFAARCPVIASNTTSLPEVAHDAALSVNPLDDVAVMHAMSQLIEDDVLVDSLKEKGHARAALFSWDACADETWSAYQRVLSR